MMDQEANLAAAEEREPLEPLTEQALPECDENVFHSGKIYCANCIHCKLITARPGKANRYVLRIRCAAGKWKKKLGEEKLYKYCTITRRYQDFCDAYEEMGDTKDFIRDLRKTLSNKDELYVFMQDTD
jgi:hypothetical protein